MFPEYWSQDLISPVAAVMETPAGAVYVPPAVPV